MSEAYTGWAILELMGHRRLAGHVSEAEMYGGRLLRIDIPSMATQFYGASAIYCIAPVTEEVALAVAEQNRPTPVQPWELPMLRPPAEQAPDPDYEVQDDEEPF